ncbi:MAG: SLBB domain-containing protein [candidate division Zixibacteria bacterium]|nr:SLBB domain-containing protein [candidate division Zixibacteria bacterium]
MVNKKLVFICLVIVLVCLNWFDHLVAQDLSSLSAVDKAALLEKYQSKSVNISKTENYQSPVVFETDTTDLFRFPDSLYNMDPDSATDIAKPALKEQVSFDKLRPFGTELFAGPREVIPPDDIATDSDYILGPGDNLIVALWGQVEKEYQLSIDREGRVFIPQVGELIVWGQSVSQFREQVQRKLSTIYSSFDLSVSLGKIRSIRVYLTGEVRRPGAYTVSSLTSLFNALYLAGGPNENGSMRTIRLMRNGQMVSEVDLYRFLLQGDNSSDVRLESGDAIFVPVAGPRVAIRGKIRRPAIYELYGDQTARELLELAGRPTPDAYLDRVMLERVSGRDDWTVMDLALGAHQPDSTFSVKMKDGDRLTIFSVFEMKRNMVAAFGLVQHPGYYERSDSTRVSDLLKRAKLQPYDVYYKRANLFRRYSDWRHEVIPVDLGQAIEGSLDHDVIMQDGDSLYVYAICDVTWDRYVHIRGEVKKEGKYLFYDNMTIEDLIFLAGSFKQGASMVRAEIARFDSAGEVTLMEINLGDPLARATELVEDDHIYIRQLPQWQLHRTIKIEGEIKYPGEYVLATRGETLYDLLIRCGGLTDVAFPTGTILERASIEESLNRKQVPSLLERSSPIVQDTLGNVKRQILFEYNAQSMNRIILDVDQLLVSKGVRGDIVLKPGDQIFVPPIPSGISVLGAVGSSGTIKFQPNKKAKYYLSRAGDYSPQADKGGLRLIRANGEVYAGNGADKKEVYQGDVLVVPTKIHKEGNWMKTFTTGITAVTGVLTTILIIDRL